MQSQLTGIHVRAQEESQQLLHQKIDSLTRTITKIASNQDGAGRRAGSHAGSNVTPAAERRYSAGAAGPSVRSSGSPSTSQSGRARCISVDHQRTHARYLNPDAPLIITPIAPSLHLGPRPGEAGRSRESSATGGDEECAGVHVQDDVHGSLVCSPIFQCRKKRWAE